MTTKYTPGPWKIGTVRDAYQEAYSRAVQTDEMTVAFCGACGGNDSLREANAHLIAAAPELLEACEAILRNLPSQTLTPPQWDYFVKNTRSTLERAIAKATEPS